MPEKKSTRILSLDLLRGYFLIVILLDHLHFYPSGLEYITGQSFMYASTAEGFFLLSGIVLGLVRGRKLVDRPFREATTKLLKRAGVLYLTSITLVLIFTLIGWTFGNNPNLKYGIIDIHTPFLVVLWKIITMQYIYGWADYLRLYAIFIFFSPIVLWLLRKGKWYVALIASFAVWTLFPHVSLGSSELTMPISWQFIFFAGFVAGFYLPAIRGWWHRLAPKTRRAIMISTWAVAFITIVANAMIVFPARAGSPTFAPINDMLSPYFNKDRLPIPRLMLFSVWFTAFLFLFTTLEKKITKYLGWILLPFGQNSLYVYTIESFVIYFVMIAYQIQSFWLPNLIASLISLSLVYLAVRTKFLMKIIPR